MRSRPACPRLGGALAATLLLAAACSGAPQKPPPSPDQRADPCAAPTACPIPKKVGHVTVALPPSAVPRRVTRSSMRVQFVVERDGSVTRLAVLEPLLAEPPWPELQEGTLEAVRQWRYEPPLCDGEPAAVCVTETVSVEISPDAPASPRR